MARARRSVVVAKSGIPPEVADQLHPLWRDPKALAAHPVFGRYVNDRVLERLRMRGRAYHQIVERWAVDAGYESDVYPRSADWNKLNEAIGNNK